MLVFDTNNGDLTAFKAAVEEAYDVNHFKDVNYFLGLEFQWSAAGDKVRINQHKYVTTILERFGMDMTRTASTPMEEHYRNQLFAVHDACAFMPRPALGALLYLALLTRPDIVAAVRLLAQETEEPTAAVKLEVERWESKKRFMVTLSTTESDYIAMATEVQECIGLKVVLMDIGVSVEEIAVMEDKQGAQHFAENKGVTQRTRHIDTKYHWSRGKGCAQGHSYPILSDQQNDS
ncbi:unnamed protein product [Phytophthora fragariaefolia]|uniref:Unnamed protein product n=1 Tax=Phytophthora fragariaefolia TaxID=1490495 RepID=A0A9W6TR78_9STRA|nr:unnamed protein product [Phytophthora fragariaefolia]